MAAGRVIIHYESLPEDDMKAQQRGLRRGLKMAAEEWQVKFAPRHFRYGAAKKYGMQPRSAKHVKRKRRRFGHNKPLVFTGETERWVRTRRQAATISNRNGMVSGKLQIRTPSYFFAFRKDFGAPDKVQELVATTQDEATKLLGIVEREIDIELAKPRRKRKKVAR